MAEETDRAERATTTPARSRPDDLADRLRDRRSPASCSGSSSAGSRLVLGAAIAIVFGLLWIRDGDARARRGRARAASRARRAAVGGRRTPTEDEHLTTTRNGFLALATLGLGAVIGAVVTLPVTRLRGPARRSSGRASRRTSTSARSRTSPRDEWMVTTFTRGRRARAMSRAAPPTSATTAEMRTASRASRSSPAAASISAVPCSRTGPTRRAGRGRGQGRQDQARPESQPAGFGCPCHGGAYDTEGNRTAGPPVRSLDRYEFSIIDGNLVARPALSASARSRARAPTPRSTATGSRIRACTSTASSAGSIRSGPVMAERRSKKSAARATSSRAPPSTRSTGSRSAPGSSAASSTSSSGTSRATSTGCRRSGRRR